MPGVCALRASLRASAASSKAREIFSRLTDREKADLNCDWPLWGRGDQSLFDIAPTWRRWLILGGRGAGKTRSGAEWVNAKVAGETWTGEASGRIALVGGTLDEARAVMVEG